MVWFAPSIATASSVLRPTSPPRGWYAHVNGAGGVLAQQPVVVEELDARDAAVVGRVDRQRRRPFAAALAPAAGAVQAIRGGRSSNGPPGVAWSSTFSHVVETMSSVSASTVSVPAPQRIVSGEPSRRVDHVVERAALEHVRALAAGDVAAAVRDRQAVRAAVADDRRPLPASAAAASMSSTSAPIRSFSSASPSLASPSSVKRGRSALAVDGDVDAVAAGDRVGADVGPQDVVAVAAAQRVVAGEAVEVVVAGAAVDACRCARRRRSRRCRRRRVSVGRDRREPDEASAVEVAGVRRSLMSPASSAARRHVGARVRARRRRSRGRR